MPTIEDGSINTTAVAPLGGPARVAIIDTGADTVIRIDDTYFITLKNVSGDGDNVITQADFVFGP
ncbi:hypothetical protein [Candidatus Viadribacter manganicus]|uniref:Uncharacterized protein n=1 Tax=Candidatus Viadribacter manganicus TaxID=1759059 RepID=A0A1B1AFR3_9PROT|nr:hypothetical protein [Candidatus Viadribacter manganicus]ANP45409.1 hypothetical protein ATE48_05505 [Candidatus Viadribacter manganicus]